MLCNPTSYSYTTTSTADNFRLLRVNLSRANEMRVLGGYKWFVSIYEMQYFDKLRVKNFAKLNYEP